MKKLKYRSNFIVSGKDEYGKMECYAEQPPGAKIWDMKAIPVRPGIDLFIIKMAALENISFCFEIANDAIKFSHCLSGMHYIQIKGINGRKLLEFRSKPGMVVISSLSNSYGYSRSLSKGIFSGVSLYVDPNLLRSYIEPELPSLPKELKKFFEGTQRHFLMASQMTGPTCMAATQIINSPYTGKAGQLFYESKALELLSLRLTALKEKSDTGSTHMLKKADIESIHAVRNLLIQNLQNPPSLVKLARDAGINEYKLKIGFKKVFDSTVFGFVQNCRMEKALALLQQGELNVSDVAWETGYTNVSHFIRAFRKKYSVNPGVFLKGVKVCTDTRKLAGN